MAIESDLTINVSKFRPENVDEETKKVNAVITELMSKGPNWYEVGPAKYREMHERGETPLPKPVFLPNSIDTTIPSRDRSRPIPIRLYKPDNGQPSKGVFLHFHGGGLVFGSHKT